MEIAGQEISIAERRMEQDRASISAKLPDKHFIDRSSRVLYHESMLTEQERVLIVLQFVSEAIKQGDASQANGPSQKASEHRSGGPQFGTPPLAPVTEDEVRAVCDAAATVPQPPVGQSMLQTRFALHEFVRLRTQGPLRPVPDPRRPAVLALLHEEGFMEGQCEALTRRILARLDALKP